VFAIIGPPRISAKAGTSHGVAWDAGAAPEVARAQEQDVDLEGFFDRVNAIAAASAAS
jgi:hypothetical protein